MAFEDLSPELQAVAVATVGYFNRRYGRRGTRLEEALSDEIGWRPTIIKKLPGNEILAVEVDDVLYPDVLKGAALDLQQFPAPVKVYQACSLEAFQKDSKQSRIRQLREHGFGIVTVDEDGGVEIQSNCVPLIQNVSPRQFEAMISGMSDRGRVAFSGAYDTYRTNQSQGLQAAGQLVEGLVDDIWTYAVEATWITVGGSGHRPAATKIDDLWDCHQLRGSRAAFGGVRDFINEYRNDVSHPPRNPREAAETKVKARDGFVNSARLAKSMYKVAHELGIRPQFHHN